MKKLWMIAGSALVMSACSDNVAEMNPAPAGNNDFVTLAEISASLPATRAYLEDVEFGAGKEVKTFWSSGDCITVWSEQEPERLLLYRLKSGADTRKSISVCRTTDAKPERNQKKSLHIPPCYNSLNISPTVGWGNT